MTAYYNEHDGFKAAWLRELIRCGHIAKGEVDERDIREVQPDDLRGFAQYHFFAGIGVWSYALRLAGWPDDRPVWTGSCPCPGFSAAGKGGGFRDARHLWPDWFRLIRECRPANIFGEQADDAIGFGWLDLVQTDLEAADYAVGKAIFGACSVGAPHIRQRLYFGAVANDGRWGTGIAGIHAGQSDAEGCRTLISAHANGAELFRKPPAGNESADRRDRETVRTRSHTELHDGRTDQPERRPQGRTADRSDVQSGSANAERGRREQRDTGQRGVSEPDAGCKIDGRGDTEQPRLQSSFRHRRLSETSRCDDARQTALGATRGFWSDAIWLPCRDGKFRPTQPGLQPVVNGFAQRMGRVCAACLQVSEEAPDDEDMRYLREIALASAQCLPKEILHPRVHGEGVYTKATDQTSRKGPSATLLSKQTMRTVRNRKGRTASAPQGPESDQQQPREHSSLVSCLSQCGPSGTCEVCGGFAEVYRVKIFGNRVGRLRGYGDAIVAQQAQAFIEAFAKGAVA